MLPADADDAAAVRTAMDNATARTVFIIGPDKKIKATLSYPMTTGRDFDEILRVLDSLQLTARHQLATPANWRQGDDVVIVPAVSNDVAKERFPQGSPDKRRQALRAVPKCVRYRKALQARCA